MIEHRHEVAGEGVVIRVVENEDDLDGFRDFIRANLDILGLDSETTGLNIYQDDFRCRLVQFGTTKESWVVPVELGERYEEEVRMALRGVSQFVIQNASYDLQVFEKTLGVPMEEMWPKVLDTKIIAHLIDPRGKDEGGSGHSLEDLTRKFIDPEIADNVKGLMNYLRLKHKTTKAFIWKIIPWEDPDYQLYAGMDAILVSRLLKKLAPLVKVPRELVDSEHKLAAVCSYMERTGFLLDVEYSEKLSERLSVEEKFWTYRASDYGVMSVNAPLQVAEGLMRHGVKIKERTPSGQPKVDKVLLKSLAEDMSHEAQPLAQAVMEAKRARKWRTTWVDGFLAQKDSQDRCHANINSLRARTARMSITGIPAQTLPSGDWMIRRCFVADEGHRIASIDYQTQELRVLAALSKDKRMTEAFANNEDLHQMTADAANVERKVGKMANFLTVYGGGPGALAVQASIEEELAKKVLDAFGKTYPGVKKLGQRLQRDATKNGYVTTPFIDGMGGRRLPVDPSRAYSSLNYIIQSSSRDVTARALLRLHDAGFTPYLRLPIHDEVLASVPEEHAEWGAKQIGQIMDEEMYGVMIGTDPEVGGRSWGSLYGADY